MNIKVLQSQVAVWAAKNAPDATNDTCLTHISEEYDELERADVGSSDHTPGEEAADIVILLCHYAELKGFDLNAEVRAKWAVVRERVYAKSEDGVYRHVEEEPIIVKQIEWTTEQVESHELLALAKARAARMEAIDE